MSPTSKLLLGLLVMLLSGVLSLAAGATWIEPSQLLAGLLQADTLSAGQQLIVTTRLTRTLMAIAVGASLAVAGALMQALTRNPLASPGLFTVTRLICPPAQCSLARVKNAVSGGNVSACPARSA